MKLDSETRNFAVEKDRENLGLESPFRFFSKWDPPISIFIEMGPPHFDFYRNGLASPFRFFSKWDVCVNLGGNLCASGSHICAHLDIFVHIFAKFARFVLTWVAICVKQLMLEEALRTHPNVS